MNFRYLRFSLNASPDSLSGPSSELVRTEISPASPARTLTKRDQRLSTPAQGPGHIAIVAAALIVLALVAVYFRRRLEQRRVLRARLASEATGHRQEADAHAARAQELGPEAEALRREATERAASAEKEAARAEELGARAMQAEQQSSREGQSAGRHDEKAAELEEKL